MHRDRDAHPAAFELSEFLPQHLRAAPVEIPPEIQRKRTNQYALAMVEAARERKAKAAEKREKREARLTRAGAKRDPG